MRLRRSSAALPKAAWNERLKLFATTLNAVGLAVLGFGVVGPMLSGVDRPLGVQYVSCLAMFAGLHLIAQLVLGSLED